jgi:ATP-binding cassette subfamily B protein
MILGFLLIMGQRAAASSQRIYAIFDEVSEIQDREGAEDVEISEGRIEFDKVSFGYADGDNVLTDLDLKIDPGETLAVVGRTGCGKSTLMRLLPRFYDVRAGSIRIDGIDVRDVRVASLRREIGMVLDEPFLFSESIHDNIAYARPDATRHEVEEVARSANAHRFVSELEHGYDTVIGERGYTLSGGQRQRIAIARAIVTRPALLIADEAVSALDVSVQAQILNLLMDLQDDLGLGILFISHDLAVVASICDHLLVMQHGKALEAGPAACILRQPAHSYTQTLLKAAGVSI